MDERSKRAPAPESVPIRVTDRRPRFDGSQDEEVSPPSDRKPSVVRELEERAVAAESKLAEALDLLRRREKEADDFRARLRKEMEKRTRSELEGRLRDFLEVIDSLDRAVSAAEFKGASSPLRDGLLKIREQFLAILSRQGVQPMELAGAPFDPERAEAVAVSPAEGPGDHDRILEEIRRGYTIDGGVLRPAQVRVARQMVPEPLGPDDSSS